MSPRKKRSVRYSLFGACAAALILVSAGVTARLLFPADKAANLVQKAFAEHFDQELRFGSARMTRLATLRLEDVKAGTNTSAKAVLISARVLPLLFGHVTVDTVRIESGAWSAVEPSSPTLSKSVSGVEVIFRRGDGAFPVTFDGRGQAAWRGAETSVTAAGAFNPSDQSVSLTALTASSGPRAILRIDGEARAALSAARWVRLRAEWSHVDPSSFTSVAKLPDGLAVRGETSGDFSLETSSFGYRAHLVSNMTSGAVEWKDVVAKAAGTTLKVDTTLIKDRATVYIRDLNVTLASIDIRGDGEIRSNGVAGETASLRLRTAEFDIEDFFRHLKVTVPDGVTLRGPVSAIVSVDGWTGGGSFVADIDGSKLDAAFKSTFRKQPEAPLRLLASGRYTTPVAVDLSSLRLDFGGIRMSGRGSYTPGKDRPTYTFRMKTNAFPLKAAADLTPMIRRYDPTGNGVISMRVIRGDDGPAMSGDITLISAGATIGGSMLSKLSGTMKFTDDALSAPSITGRLDDSPLLLDLRAHRYGQRPFFEADVTVDEINLGRYLSVATRAADASAGPFDTSGVLRAGHIEHPQFSADDLTIEWNLSAIGAEPAALNGLVSWRQGPGHLGNAREILLVSTAARASIAPLILIQQADGAAFSGISFEAIDNDVTFSDGKTRTVFSLQSDDRKAELKGTAGITRQDPLTATLVLRTPARRATPVRMTVSGSPDEPVFTTIPSPQN